MRDEHRKQKRGTLLIQALLAVSVAAALASEILLGERAPWVRQTALMAAMMLVSLCATLLVLRGRDRRRRLEAEKHQPSDADRAGLAAAIAQAAEAVVITDREGRIRYVNPAFTQMTGYSGEEAAGQNPRILKSGR